MHSTKGISGDQRVLQSLEMGESIQNSNQKASDKESGLVKAKVSPGGRESEKPVKTAKRNLRRKIRRRRPSNR